MSATTIESPTPSLGVRTLSRADFLVGLALTIATIVYVVVQVQHPIAPMEDASMLLRYSQNLAQGHGIVWNIGEHPVEGATDFLYMALIGWLSRLFSWPVKTSAAVILTISQGLSAGVLYAALRRYSAAPRSLAAGFALLLGCGLGFRYVSTGFSPPLYALFALLTWVMGVSCTRDGLTHRRAILFGSFAFITGLIRPDGVLLAGFILISVLYSLKEGRPRLLLWFVAIFAVSGGIYFAWRLRYFGYPFPNPFYIKQNGGISIVDLLLSTRYFLEMTMPLLPLAGFAVLTHESRRRFVAWAITVVCFISIWSLMSLDNNHFSRFQYALVPITVLELGGFAAMAWVEFRARYPDSAALAIRPLRVVLLVFFVFVFYYNSHLYNFSFTNEGAKQLAERLKPYAPKHYTMLVTEAGDLPFYSQWRALDMIGLNDEYIAHHGGLLTQEYLEMNKPEIILYNDHDWPMHHIDLAAIRAEKVPGMGDKLTWDATVSRDYALAHHYILAARWGARYCNYHTYWVRSDFPDSAAIVSAIRDHPYYSQADGQLSFDFRDAQPPSVPCDISQPHIGLIGMFQKSR